MDTFKFLIVTLALSISILMPATLQASDAFGAAQYPGFRVKGRHLYDRAGEKVILTGVNKMIIWTDIDGLPAFPEIAKTGANAVRITWLSSGTAEQLDTVLTNSILHQMIPLVDCHDSTGDWSKLSTCVDYWVRPDVRAVLKKHEEYLLINIANEAGQNAMHDIDYKAGYELAIKRMRAAGIHVPLVIDASQWGQYIDGLQENGPYLIEVDPDHNLMFSIHMWWPTTRFEKAAQMIGDEIRQSVEQELPLIVGEFSEKAQQCACCIPYETILEECHLHEVGWFAWSWGPGNNDCSKMDMTQDGRFDTLHEWGLNVALAHPYSIKNIAVRPASVLTAAKRIVESGAPDVEPLPAKTDGPDLRLTDIHWEPEPAVHKQALSFSTTVKNIGNAATPDDAVLRCLFQVDGQTVSWVEIVGPSIAPGQSIELTANAGPEEEAVWQAIVGNRVLFAWVNPKTAEWPEPIAEQNETNNMLTKALTVRLKAPK